jgi:hypothetical protein
MGVKEGRGTLTNRTPIEGGSPAPGDRGIHDRAVSHLQTRQCGRHVGHDRVGVGEDPHRAAEGVDLADDLPLGHAADGRVAAHLADGIAVERQEGGPASQPRGGQRRLQPRVPRAHHNHIKRCSARSARSSGRGRAPPVGRLRRASAKRPDQHAASDQSEGATCLAPTKAAQAAETADSPYPDGGTEALARSAPRRRMMTKLLLTLSATPGRQRARISAPRWPWRSGAR